MLPKLFYSGNQQGSIYDTQRIGWKSLMSIDCDVAAFQSGSITVKLQDQLIELPKLLIPTYFNDSEIAKRDKTRIGCQIITILQKSSTTHTGQTVVNSLYLV